jgi:putative flippase GtrA
MLSAAPLPLAAVNERPNMPFANPLRHFSSRVLAAPLDGVLVLQAFRFAAVGVVNTAVDFTVFLFAFTFFTASLVGANVFSWSVAVTGSYVMNSFFTFSVESGRRLRIRSYLGFTASSIVGLMANTATLLFVAKLLVVPVILAKMAAIGAGFLVNFSLARFVVFRPSEANQIAGGGSLGLPVRSYLSPRWGKAAQFFHR